MRCLVNVTKALLIKTVDVEKIDTSLNKVYRKKR